MTPRLAVWALILAGTAAACDSKTAGKPPATTRLRAAPPHSLIFVSGDLKTSSSRALSAAGGDVCGSRRHGRELLYESYPMRLHRGSGNLRIAFHLRHLRGSRTYSAVRPRVEYGRTPLQASTARNATTGVATAFFQAKRGTVTVIFASGLGTHRDAYAGGLFEGELVDRASHRRLTVRARWVCGIEPTANG